MSTCQRAPGIWPAGPCNREVNAGKMWKLFMPLKMPHKFMLPLFMWKLFMLPFKACIFSSEDWGLLR
jgi:hypothetical protein